MKIARPLPATTAPLIAVLLLAAGLRLVSITHGWPRNYVPDNTVVRAGLSLGAGMNPWRGEALPTQYPYLVPYLLFTVYAGFYLAGRLVGAFPSVAQFETFAFDHPEIFFLLGRLVVALFGCLLVFLVFRVAERLAGRTAALAAALFCATSLILVQMSQQARPHVIAACLIVASLLAALKGGDHGDRAILLSWVLAALAASTSPYGLLAFSIPVLATVRAPSGAARRRTLIGGLLAAGVVLVACYPRLLLAPGSAFGYDPDSGLLRYYDGLLVRRSFFNGAGFGKLARWAALYEPTLLLGFLGGLVTIWRRRERLAEWTLAAAYPLLFVLTYGIYEVIHPRYLVSLVPFLALPAGLFVAAACRRLSEEGLPAPSGGRRALATALLLIAFGWPVLQAVRLDILLTRADSRELARAWIVTQLPPRGTIGLEAHGVQLEADPESLRHIARAGVERLGLRDRHRLEKGTPGWRIRRLWEMEGYRNSEPAELVGSSGLDYVATVRRGDEERRDRFYVELERVDERLASFDPRRPGADLAETELPTELDNPFTGLWRVDRPGPIVEVFSLSP